MGGNKIKINKTSINKILITVGYIVLIAGITPIIFRQIHANDLWKALYSGRYISVFYQFPHHSTFTYSPVHELITHDTYNWLGNLMIFGVYKSGDLIGLQFLRITIAIWAVLFLHSQTNFTPHPVAFFVLLLVVFGISQKLRLRTAIMAVPFTLILIYLWTQYDFTNKQQYLWGIPVLFLLWGNMHGSYIIGVGLFFALLIGKTAQIAIKVVKKQGKNNNFLSLALVTLVTITAVTFIKPYADMKVLNTISKLPMRLIQGGSAQKENIRPGGNRQRKRKTAKQKTWYGQINKKLQHIIAPPSGFRSSEFSSPLANTQYAFVKANIAIAVLGLVYFVVYGVSLSYLPLIIATLLLGTTYLRSMAYIALVFGALFFAHLRHKKNLWIDSISLKVTFFSIMVGIVFGGLSIVSTSGLSSLTNQHYHRFGAGVQSKFSNDGAKYVLTNLADKRVANSFNIGGFLIWKWWPHKKVFIDSKTSSYPPSFWNNLRQNGLLAYLNKHNINYFIIETDNKNTALFNKNPNWVVEYENGEVYIFKNIRVR